MNTKPEYYMGLTKTFKKNIKAVKITLEQNHEKENGLHVHILMQFSTRHDLSREQFVKHFGSDSVHIASKPNKEALMNAIVYVAKTGNYIEWCVFEHRGVELKDSAEEYRFMRLVKSIEDARLYFNKSIQENYSNAKPYMERVQEKDTMMSRYLLEHKALCRNLVKQEEEARKKVI